MVLKLITNKLFNMSRLEQVNGWYAKILAKVYQFEGKIAFSCIPLFWTLCTLETLWMLMKLKFYGTTFDFKLIFGYEQIGAGQWPLCLVKTCP